ncbi:hypothetical protein BDV96DRAFT_664582 [Lophiotrema nucula]|uniref:SEP domain-containing protein n=1 Tax=Lophiotrema nucula TaxID=690887 RepID=A0A6A5Z1Q2_9PLEO|nr:hypothetical protein BDV96DRAFT_664582 [Lophiotrema nucula]
MDETGSSAGSATRQESASFQMASAAGASVQETSTAGDTLASRHTSTFHKTPAGATVHLSGSGMRPRLENIVDALDSGAMSALQMPPPGLDNFTVEITFLESTAAAAFAGKYPRSVATIDGIELHVTCDVEQSDADAEVAIYNRALSRAFIVWRPKEVTITGTIKDARDGWPLPQGPTSDRDYPNKLYLWKDGFSTNDGSLLSYDTDERLIAAMHTGQAPAQLFGLQEGEHVKVEVRVFKDLNYISSDLRERRVTGYTSKAEKSMALRLFGIRTLDPATTVRIRFLEEDQHKGLFGLYVECTGIVEAAELIDSLLVPSSVNVPNRTFEFVQDPSSAGYGGLQFHGPLPPQPKIQVAAKRYAPIKPVPQTLEVPLNAITYRILTEQELITHPLFWEMAQDCITMQKRCTKKNNEHKTWKADQKAAGQAISEEDEKKGWRPTDWICWREGCEGVNYSYIIECYHCHNSTRWEKVMADNQEKYLAAMGDLPIAVHEVVNARTEIAEASSTELEGAEIDPAETSTADTKYAEPESVGIITTKAETIGPDSAEASSSQTEIIDTETIKTPAAETKKPQRSFINAETVNSRTYREVNGIPLVDPDIEAREAERIAKEEKGPYFERNLVFLRRPTPQKVELPKHLAELFKTPMTATEEVEAIQQ